jgi:hypothetical protein
MPEMLTKHPEIALKILKDAHIRCGMGDKQQILVNCPKEDFCALPTGELCIYGVNNVSHMTQISPIDVMLSSSAIVPFSALMVMLFLGGILVGLKITKK